jgi:hypothetical protein
MKSLAKRINRLGDQFIEKFGIREFHHKAAELLATADFAGKYDLQSIAEICFNSGPTQNFKHLEFSDLPVTLSYGTHCFIDLYFWRRRPTVIHNHHFAGAFTCLTGNNVDLEFKFTKTRKLGKYHDLGELKLKRSRRLSPGDIAEIGLMNKFIHQNHHHADLTVNLCFRTPQLPARSLSNYLYSGLRFEKNAELLGRVGRLQRLLNIGAFDHRKLELTLDDAIQFLIQSYESKSQNPRLIKLRKILDQRVRRETGLNIDSMMDYHEMKISELEEDYE